MLSHNTQSWEISSYVERCLVCFQAAAYEDKARRLEIDLETAQKENQVINQQVSAIKEHIFDVCTENGRRLSKRSFWNPGCPAYDFYEENLWFPKPGRKAPSGAAGAHLCLKLNFMFWIFFQFNEQLESARELETNQAQMRGQIQEAQKHVSKTGVLVTHLLLHLV